jgi:hypothetical protein
LNTSAHHKATPVKAKRRRYDEQYMRGSTQLTRELCGGKMTDVHWAAISSSRVWIVPLIPIKDARLQFCQLWSI